ncbi:hypothetical protein L3X38_010484 [Prunus dulcis]|uniref:Uncharacterized protein n=1 Tax=Prunus dulcis TaxID=3755 RepID=A0AAD4ZE71_PRUDU|nr:hypothetical protein L3X38_010484 [Prunus dulcis]
MIFDTPYVERNTGHNCFKLAGGKPPPRSCGMSARAMAGGQQRRGLAMVTTGGGRDVLPAVAVGQMWTYGIVYLP